LTPTIGVKLIQYDKFDTVRVRNDSAIQRILARHQQFKHHEVRKEDVRLLFADALALFLALLASVAGEHRPQRLGQAGLTNELFELFQLAVCQRVHRVDDDCARAPRLASRPAALWR
jgi:hypothetical protein